MIYESSNYNITISNTNSIEDNLEHNVPPIDILLENSKDDTDTSNLRPTFQSPLIEAPLIMELTQEDSILIPTTDPKKRPALSSTTSMSSSSQFQKKLSLLNQIQIKQLNHHQKK